MSERQEMIGHADRGARASRPTEANARDWVKALAPYREPRLGRSLAELAVTTVPFVALWVAMLLSLRYSYWLCLLLAVPGSGFVVRKRAGRLRLRAGPCLEAACSPWPQPPQAFSPVPAFTILSAWLDELRSGPSSLRAPAEPEPAV